MNYFTSCIFFMVCSVCFSCCSYENTTTNATKVTDASSSNDQKWVQNQGFAKQLPHILEPCLESEHYQSKDWIGINNCSWALEKEILLELPEYVKRDKKGLKFQTDEAGWHSITAADAMVNLYLPEVHKFVLKFLPSENCELYGIYDPIADSLTQYNGQFFLHPNQKNFAIIPSPDCSKKAIIGRFLKGKGVLTQEIEEKSVITGIKWNKEEMAYLIKNGENNNFIYLKLP